MNRRDREAAHQAAVQAMTEAVPEADWMLWRARSLICDELAERPVLAAGSWVAFDSADPSGLFALAAREPLVSSNTGPPNGYEPSLLLVAVTRHGVRVVTPAGQVLELHSPKPTVALAAFQGEGARVVEVSDLPGLPTPPVIPEVRPRVRLSDPLNCMVDGYVLGGGGDWGSLRIGEYVAAHFEAEHVVVLAGGVPQGDPIVYPDLAELEALGPGEVTERLRMSTERPT